MLAYVSYGNAQSKNYCLSRYQTSCVFAPTQFSPLLVATLEVAFRSILENVYIQTRRNTNMFMCPTSKLRAKLRVYLYRKCSLLMTMPSLLTLLKKIHVLVGRFEGAARGFSILINIKKTECLY